MPPTSARNVQAAASSSGLSHVVVRQCGSNQTCKTFPLRRLPLPSPASGNAYEAGGVQLQFRALFREQNPNADSWAVAVREPDKAQKWSRARMSCAAQGTNCWDVELLESSTLSYSIDFGSNDTFSLAAYDAHLPFQADDRLDPAGPRCIGDSIDSNRTVDEEFPFWPDSVKAGLSRWGLTGPGAVVFHTDTFIELLYLSAFPAPVLFPHAAYRLGTRLGSVAKAVQQLRGYSSADDDEFSWAQAILNGAGEDGILSLDGGRLIGWMEGGLGQVGDDLLEGLDMVTAEPAMVTFPEAPMGIGLGPMTDDETGAQVTGVDPGSIAEISGVQEGWQIVSVNGEDVSEAPFWDVDARFDEPPPWRVVFDPASKASNLYAVELPATDLLNCMPPHPDNTLSEENGIPDAEVGKHLSRVQPAVPPFVWQEEFARLFLGDAGSVTCLHVDLLPQLEFCHMLSGCKVLGAASWIHSPKLLMRYGGKRGPTDSLLGGEAAHVGEDEELEAVFVPSDKDLLQIEQQLLEDPRVSLVLAQPGDAAVFSSAAAHFATNGAGGPSSALYHGALNPAAIHRLCIDAAGRDPFTSDERAGEYAAHLTARDLVKDYGLGMADGMLEAAELNAAASFATSCGLQFLDGTNDSLVGVTLAERYEECLQKMELALRFGKEGKAPPQWAGETSWWYHYKGTALKKPTGS